MGQTNLNVEQLIAKYAPDTVTHPIELQPKHDVQVVAPLELVNERPEHHLLVYLKTLGHTYEEVAKLTGRSALEVQRICCQPWARQQQIRVLQDHADDNMLNEMLNRAAAGSIKCMIELRDDPKVPAGVRAKICTDLLDRRMGKAIQRVQAEVKTNHEDSVEDLDAQLKALRAAEQDLYGRPKLRSVGIPQDAEPGDSAA